MSNYTRTYLELTTESPLDIRRSTILSDAEVWFAGLQTTGKRARADNGVRICIDTIETVHYGLLIILARYEDLLHCIPMPSTCRIACSIWRESIKWQEKINVDLINSMSKIGAIVDIDVYLVGAEEMDLDDDKPLTVSLTLSKSGLEEAIAEKFAEAPSVREAFTRMMAEGAPGPQHVGALYDLTVVATGSRGRPDLVLEPPLISWAATKNASLNLIVEL